MAGGDLNDAYAARLADNRVVFVKTSADAAPGSYTAEAAGLRWIASAAGAPAVPEVLAVTAAERGSGTAAELESFRYLEQKMREYGYSMSAPRKSAPFF